MRRKGRPPASIGRLRLLPAALAIVALLSAGCTSPPKPDETLQELAKHGYVSKKRFGTTTLRETWQRGEASLDVSFIAPSSGGPFPLIVYLPGLGESASGGILWRKIWAEAGYAVLTIQPAETGKAIWASRQARAGDFRELAETHFSRESLAVRLDHLAYALGEAKRRAGAGVMPYSRADTTRVVIAGFDLGTQTAMTVAGKGSAGVGTPLTGWDFRALIMLSPYVDPALRQDPRQLAAISVPVLCVTGTEDADPFELISSPAQRQAVWQALPPGDKYLLLVNGATHALLTGADIYSHDSVFSSPAGNETDTTNQKQQDGKRKNQNGGTGVMENASAGAIQLNEAEGDQQEATGNAGKPARGRPRPLDRGPRTYSLQAIAAVQDVSVAFLDATVKGERTAREWLTRDVASWLDGSAVLQVK